MAERRGKWDKEDDLPVYLARPGTADQVPRQKYGGLFCSVQDAFDSKTIDFDALSVGQRGSRTPRSAKRDGGQEARSPARDEDREEAENIRTTAAEAELQTLGAEKVRAVQLLHEWRGRCGRGFGSVCAISKGAKRPTRNL